MKNPDLVWETIKQIMSGDAAREFKREDVLRKSGIQNSSFTSVFQHMCKEQPGGAPRFQERLKGILTRSIRGGGWYFLSEVGRALLREELPESEPMSLVGECSREISASGYFELPATRDRVMREVAMRYGQAQFREELMVAYKQRCAVTSCDAAPALEAAHIRAYTDRSSNTISNGLLLRCDIHTLFDLGLIAIRPGILQLVLSPMLRETTYSSYDGARIAVPEAQDWLPEHSALMERWVRFEAMLSAGDV